jgi:hypothetical protein
MIMVVRSIAALVFVTITLSVSAASWDDDSHYVSIQVARFRGDPFCNWVDLAPGVKIYLLKQSGRVTAILAATDHPRAGSQWIETDDNWSLQNILIALFGQPAPGLP